MQTFLVISSSYAALLTFLLLALAYRVVLLRRKLLVGVGDGHKQELRRAIGAHQNAAENIPIMVILMVLYEMVQGADIWLHSCAVVFTLGRLLNAWGVSHYNNASASRVYGMWMTVVAMATMAFLNVGVRI